MNKFMKWLNGEDYVDSFLRHQASKERKMVIIFITFGILMVLFFSCNSQKNYHIDKQEELYKNRKKQKALKNKGYPSKSRKQSPKYRDKNAI